MCFWTFTADNFLLNWELPQQVMFAHSSSFQILEITINSRFFLRNLLRPKMCPYCIWAYFCQITVHFDAALQFGLQLFKGSELLMRLIEILIDWKLIYRKGLDDDRIFPPGSEIRALKLRRPVTILEFNFLKVRSFWWETLRKRATEKVQIFQIVCEIHALELG